MLAHFTSYLGSVSWTRRNKKPPKAEELWVPLEERIKRDKVKKTKQRIIEESKAGTIDLAERRAAMRPFKEDGPIIPHRKN